MQNPHAQQAPQIQPDRTDPHAVHKQITRGGVLVSKEFKKWKLVTSHSARRSFATNMYKLGIKPVTIMGVTGHATETAFMKYLKLTSEEHAEIMMKPLEKMEAQLRVV